MLRDRGLRRNLTDIGNGRPVEDEDLGGEIGIEVIGAHHRENISPGELADLLADLVANRFLVVVAKGQDVLAATFRNQNLFALGQILFSMTNTTFSRIVVRAFVGPRPVYSRISRTVTFEIAAYSAFPP